MLAHACVRDHLCVELPYVHDGWLQTNQHVPNVEFPEVISVNLNTYHQVHTTQSWDFLGLHYNNNQQQQPGLLERAKYGQDVIIGVVDSGSNLTNNSIPSLVVGDSSESRKEMRVGSMY